MLVGTRTQEESLQFIISSGDYDVNPAAIPPNESSEPPSLCGTIYRPWDYTNSKLLWNLRKISSSFLCISLGTYNNSEVFLCKKAVGELSHMPCDLEQFQAHPSI